MKVLFVPPDLKRTDADRLHIMPFSFMSNQRDKQSKRKMKEPV